MDRIRLIPDQLFLTDEAADRTVTTQGFNRRVISRGKERPQSMTITLTNGHHQLFTVVCHPLSDRRWRIGCIDLNLPALVHGHNGRPILAQDELVLALTRLRHFLRKITIMACHDRLIPGVGRHNVGFISYLEAMIQIQDPEHRLLRASHVAHLPYQQKPALVCWGESTRFRSREVDLSFYDKNAQRRHGHALPPDIPGVRIEQVLKQPERIARQVAATGSYSGQKGEVVRTMSLRSSYALVHQAVSRMSGWGMVADDTLSNLSGPARLLILGLGSGIGKPYALQEAIDRYKEVCAPCDRTLRSVIRAMSAYATSYTGGFGIPVLPADMDDLAISEIRHTGDEADYKALLSQLEAPSHPDPEISQAWSVTTFLPRRPDGFEIIGRTGPEPTMPWKQTL